MEKRDISRLNNNEPGHFNSMVDTRAYADNRDCVVLAWKQLTILNCINFFALFISEEDRFCV